jgi:hypothetical protein
MTVQLSTYNIYRLGLALLLVLTNIPSVFAQINVKVDTVATCQYSNIRLDEATKETPHPELAVLQFEETANTRYALDPYRDIYAKVTEYFLAYKPTTKDMTASAKFMLPGVSDEIFVRIAESHEGFDASKVHFVTDKGQEYKGVYTGQGWTLTLAGGAAGDGQHLYAVQETAPGKYATLTRLNIYTYEPKSIKVRLIPVNGFTNGFTANRVSQELNAIYNKAGITCEVEIAGSFDYAPLESGTFNVTGSGLFSTLTDDMKALNAAYLQAHPDETSLCLFLIENASGTEGMAGDMPRGKQFGYLFQGATAQTIAHEIGHGLFHLDHPFDRANAARSFDRGDLADNLMEYQGGTNLVKLQWDAIHAPGFVIGVFERDEDAMAKDESTDILSQIIEKILSVGENGCGFIRRQTSSAPNKELNVSVTTTTSDYLIGKTENGNILFDIETRITQRIEIFHQIIQFIVENEKNEFVLWVANGKIQVCEAAEDYSQFSSLSNSKDDPVFLNKYKTDLFSCKGLLEILLQLKSYVRNNQEVELFHENNVYRIDNNKLALVELSEEAINAGEWADMDKNTRIRYYINEAGIIQVKAFGFRKDLSTIKSVDLFRLANCIKEQSNKFLRENQVKDFTTLAPAFVNTDEVFADGKRIEIGGDKSTFVKIISEGIGLTTTLLKTGEIEESAYLESTAGTTTIHAPGLVTGSVEVIVQKVTDITALATTLYDLVIDKEVRSQLYNQFVEIKDGIGENPQNFIPILGDVILTVATGNSAEEWKATLERTTDTGKRSHLATRGTGNAIITVVAGTAIVNNLPDIAEQLTENIRKVRNISKNLGEFASKSLSEKLEDIKNIWKTKYPIEEMFEGRTFFEDIMGEYRYTKADGWGHTSDIAENFKGVDFYKDFTVIGDRIFAEIAVSMKTTIMKNIDDWIKVNKSNIDVMANSMGSSIDKGIIWSGKRLFYNKAELHIYIPKENFSPQFKSEWINKLSSYNPNVKYEIDVLEDFIK